MSYAPELQRSALMGSGFILLLIILIINLCLTAVKKGSSGNKFFTRRFKEGGAERVTGFKRTGSIQDLLWIISWIVAVFVAFVLGFIVVYVLVSGLPHLSADFLFGQSSNAKITLAPLLFLRLCL